MSAVLGHVPSGRGRVISSAWEGSRLGPSERRSCFSASQYRRFSASELWESTWRPTLQHLRPAGLSLSVFLFLLTPLIKARLSGVSSHQSCDSSKSLQKTQVCIQSEHLFETNRKNRQRKLAPKKLQHISFTSVVTFVHASFLIAQLLSGLWSCLLPRSHQIRWKH